MISLFYISLVLVTIVVANPTPHLTRIARDGVEGITTATTTASTTASTTSAPYVCEDLQNMLGDNDYVRNYAMEEMMPRVSCSEWKSYTDRSGLFRISPTGGCEYKVYCDMCLESEQGWIIIQRRLNDSVAFENKNWEEYKRGFGNYLGNYWMGLEALHEITSSGTYHLYIGFRISSFTDPKYAYYSGFSIGNEGNSYTLSYSSYVQANSTASNDRLAGHKGKPFTTHDVDNDNVLDGNTAINCAEHSGHQFGGWWFGISNAYTVVKDNCYESNLNGKFYSTGSETAGNGIKWKNAGSTDSSMLATVMAIRRV